LIDDTTRQTGLMEVALRNREGQRLMRLARNSERACSNVGADAAAAALQTIGRCAALAQFEEARTALGTLREEIETLRGIPWGKEI